MCVALILIGALSTKTANVSAAEGRLKLCCIRLQSFGSELVDCREGATRFQLESSNEHETNCPPQGKPLPVRRPGS